MIKHLTSKELTAHINYCNEKGRAISNNAAATIASYYHSPAARDENITGLSHWTKWNSAELRTEINRLRKNYTDKEDKLYLSALSSWLSKTGGKK